MMPTYADPAPPQLSGDSGFGQTRLRVPSTIPLHAQLRTKGLRGNEQAALARELGLRSAVVRLTDNRAPTFSDGDTLRLTFQHHSHRTVLDARVAAVTADKVYLSFDAVSPLNVDLFAIALEAALPFVCLAAPSRRQPAAADLRHFLGPGLFDLRLRASRGWWRLAFLDVLLLCSPEQGLTSAVVDRTVASSYPAPPSDAPDILRQFGAPASLAQLLHRLGQQLAQAFPDYGPALAALSQRSSQPARPAGTRV